MFERGLKRSSYHTSGRGVPVHYGRSSLLLSEASRESICVGDGELVYRPGPQPGRAAPVCSNVPQREPDQLGASIGARDAVAVLMSLRNRAFTLLIALVV